MEPQDEKTEQIHRKRGRQSSSSFPLDLISEIFLKLPVKSVGRFRCVSKLWSSIATDPYFINKFETHQSPKRPSLFQLSFKSGDKLFVFSIPQDHQSSCSSQPVDSYHMTYPKYSSFSPKKSVHGLICFLEASKPIIWNPTMRQFLTLPKPERSWKRITVFLGYDPIEGKHKVVCMPFDRTIDECCVWTLGLAEESWRKIKTNHKHRPFTKSSYQCIDGVLYYKAYNVGVAIIMSFEVRLEKFHMIKLPWNHSDYFGSVLTTYKGRLACVKFHCIDHRNKLWIMEDDEKHEWSCLHISAPINHYDQYLSGITDAGEFFYVPSSFHKSFYILYYDPKRSSFKRVEVKGIADEEFRVKNGLGNKRLTRIHTFVNHRESLMSL